MSDADESADGIGSTMAGRVDAAPTEVPGPWAEHVHARSFEDALAHLRARLGSLDAERASVLVAINALEGLS